MTPPTNRAKLLVALVLMVFLLYLWFRPSDVVHPEDMVIEKPERVAREGFIPGPHSPSYWRIATSVGNPSPFQYLTRTDRPILVLECADRNGLYHGWGKGAPMAVRMNETYLPVWRYQVAGENMYYLTAQSERTFGRDMGQLYDVLNHHPGRSLIVYTEDGHQYLFTIPDTPRVCS